MEAKNGRTISKSYLAESTNDINPAILLSGLLKKKKNTYSHHKTLTIQNVHGISICKSTKLWTTQMPSNREMDTSIFMQDTTQCYSARMSKWLSHNIAHLTDINAEWKKSDTEEYVFI